MRMSSNKARVATRPFRKWPPSQASLPRIPPKPWAPFANPNDDLNVDFLAREFYDLSVTSANPNSSTTSAGVGTSASPSASDVVRDVFHCLPMDVTASPDDITPTQSDSESEIVFRGDGTVDSPFTEVINGDKPAKLDIKACMKHLKKVARCYGFRVIEVTWVVSSDSSPDSSPEPEERGPNVVPHPRHPPSKSLRTIAEPAFWGGRTHADVYRRKDDMDMSDPILIANKDAIAASVDMITKNLVKCAARK